MTESKNRRHVYMIVVAAISFAATITCAINTRSLPDSFKGLWYLPLFNTLVTVIFVSVIMRGNFYFDIPILLITSLFTVRNAVTPLVMSVTTCASRLGIYRDSRMINLAIAMFLYETVTVYAYLYFIRKKTLKNKIHISFPWRAPSGLFMLMLTGGLIVSILAFIVLPELRTQYYTIFTDDITHLAHDTANYGGGIKRALSTSANIIIEATRLSLSSYLIFKLRKYKECWLTYFACLVIILAQFFFINDSNAYVIMIAFALYMLVYKLFPRYGKQTLRYLAIIFIAFFILIYVNRFSKDIYGTSLSLFLQAYFPGLNNFASIEPILDRSFLQVIRQVFIDLYAAVPFRSTLFGYQGGLDALPTLWHRSIGLFGQIMPNIAQSYYYFGPVFSPILSILLCSIGVKSFKKANSTKNPCLYSAYTYLGLYACIAITMYDFYIFMTMLLTRYLFMYLLSCFCEAQMSLNNPNSELYDRTTLVDMGYVN